MSMSNYLESKLLNHMLGKGAFTMPATVYLALFTSDPGEAGSLANEVPTGRGYARQAITSTMSTSTGGSASTNGSVIAFGPNTAVDWGTITHIALIDVVTAGAGNLLISGALAVSRLIQIGDRGEFAIGALSAAFD